MKIICESEEEYDELMKTSRYLHDFSVFIEVLTSTSRVLITDEENEFELGATENDYVSRLNNDFGCVNFLQHLYLDGDDFPNKNEIVIKSYE